MVAPPPGWECWVSPLAVPDLGLLCLFADSCSPSVAPLRDSETNRVQLGLGFQMIRSNCITTII